MKKPLFASILVCLLAMAFGVSLASATTYLSSESVTLTASQVNAGGYYAFNNSMGYTNYTAMLDLGALAGANDAVHVEIFDSVYHNGVLLLVTFLANGTKTVSVANVNNYSAGATLASYTGNFRYASITWDGSTALAYADSVKYWTFESFIPVQPTAMAYTNNSMSAGTMSGSCIFSIQVYNSATVQMTAMTGAMVGLMMAILPLMLYMAIFKMIPKMLKGFKF